jgi:hypothetical protein
MKIIYDKNKGKEFDYPECKGVICGYTDAHLLLATKTTTEYTFRKFKEFHFIEEEFKDKSYRYCYVLESYL